MLPAPDRPLATVIKNNIIMSAESNLNRIKPSHAAQFSDVPAARKRLLRVMQENPYSRIEHLAVISGEPAFGPNTKIIAETKFGVGDGPRREAGLPDYALKKEVVELFQQLNHIGSGEVLTLEIRGGLPFRMIREVAA